MNMGLEGDDLDAMKKRLRRIIDGLPDAVKEAVDESLEEGKEHSVGIVHVVTGRLRDSIRTENVSEEGGDLVAGGTGGVDYAAHEEFGTARREPHPFLSSGYQIAQRQLPQKMKEKLRDLMH